MNSALYVGWVSHRRFTPKNHSLRYAVFQMLLDLDEVEAVGRRLRLFSANRANVFSHFDADHGEGRRGALRAWAEETLAEAGIAFRGGQILLLAMPRLFGHVFNPLSIYYCHDRSGALAATIYEVNNTFGERHTYAIAAEPRGNGAVRQSCAKTFRVSPFLPMAMNYEFELSPPGTSIHTGVKALDASGRLVLTAAFTGERRELSDRSLLGALLRFPFLTLKVVAAIHLEAVKLWLKGVRPAASVEARSIASGAETCCGGGNGAG
jgi:hypothetical protein